jgi:peptidoglycan biosynthesis protein MviN/MurJ (putative lipid II flippase)
VEFFLLRRALAAKIGAEPIGALYLLRLWVAAALAAGAAWAIKLTWPVEQAQLSAVTTLVPFALVYLLIAGPRKLLTAQ